MEIDNLSAEVLSHIGPNSLNRALLPQRWRFESVWGQKFYHLQSEGKNMYQDKTLICKDCGEEFIFTAGEQEFYAEKGFQNEPQRCKACRDLRKNSSRPAKELFTTTCANCGKEAKVPFQPSNDRPVYCSECYAQMKQQ